MTEELHCPLGENCPHERERAAAKARSEARVAEIMHDARLHADVEGYKKLVQLGEDGVLTREQVRDLLAGDRHKSDDSFLRLMIRTHREILAWRHRAEHAEGALEHLLGGDPVNIHAELEHSRELFDEENPRPVPPDEEG